MISFITYFFLLMYMYYLLASLIFCKKLANIYIIIKMWTHEISENISIHFDNFDRNNYW